MRIITFLLINIIFPSLLLASNLKINSNFPNTNFNGKYLTNSEKKYLELKGESAEFTINQIHSKYIVLEFINVYCFACQKQAPEFNKFYNKLKNKSDLKFFAVALGNTVKEINIFKKRFNIKFPIVPDEKFKIYTAIGGTRTPFTLIFKNKKIVYGHLGLIETYKELYAVLLAKQELNRIVQKEKYKPEPIGDNFVIEKIKPIFSKITDITKEKNFYKVFADDKIFYVITVSSPSVCNICHPVQFIYIVDSKGYIVDFIPIHLTKRFNKTWNKKETEKMRNKLIGKNIFKNLQFNKHVDAVTSATITSSMIFFHINKAKNFIQRK